MLAANNHGETHTGDLHTHSYTHTHTQTGVEGRFTAAILQRDHQSEHLSPALEIALTDNGTVDYSSMQFSF